MLAHQTAFCCDFFHAIFIWNFFEGTHGIFWWIYGLVISYSHDSISWFSSNLNSSFSRFFSILFNFPQFSPIFLIFSQLFSILPLLFIFISFFSTFLRSTHSYLSLYPPFRLHIRKISSNIFGTIKNFPKFVAKNCLTSKNYLIKNRCYSLIKRKHGNKTTVFSVFYTAKTWIVYMKLCISCCRKLFADENFYFCIAAQKLFIGVLHFFRSPRYCLI